MLEIPSLSEFLLIVDMLPGAFDFVMDEFCLSEE
jgi:hypothetical protein